MAKSLNDASLEVHAKSSEFSLGPAKIAFDNATAQVSALADASKANDQVKALAQQLAKTASPQNKEQVKQIETASDNLNSKLQTSIASAKNIQLPQDQIIQQDATGLATGSGSYGIVVSADKKDDLTDYEIQQLKKRNFNAAVYDRGGFLRTVALFPDADAANQQLATIQQYRKSAYVINITNWCKTATPERTLEGVSALKCQ